MKVTEGKPTEDDHVRGMVHEADSVAYNLAHAKRHIEVAIEKAQGFTKKVKKVPSLRKEAIKLASVKAGVISK